MNVKRYTAVLNERGRVFLREIDTYNLPNKTSIMCDSGEAVFKFAREVLKLHELAEEEFWMLAINSKCKVIGIFMISHGTVNATIASPREILMRALLVGATNMIVLHNHPSGSTEPSKDDVYTTKRIQEACNLIGIKLVDHIIVGNDFYSFKGNDKI